MVSATKRTKPTSQNAWPLGLAFCADIKGSKMEWKHYNIPHKKRFRTLVQKAPDGIFGHVGHLLLHWWGETGMLSMWTLSPDFFSMITAQTETNVSVTVANTWRDDGETITVKSLSHVPLGTVFQLVSLIFSGPCMSIRHIITPWCIIFLRQPFRTLVLTHIIPSDHFWEVNSENVVMFLERTAAMIANTVISEKKQRNNKICWNA